MAASTECIKCANKVSATFACYVTCENLIQ